MSAHKQNPADLLHRYELPELERIAQSFHDGVGFSIPVDIENILEKQDGIDLDVWPKLAANHKLLGWTGIYTDRPGIIFVFIDDDLADDASMESRYRMTVAEELGHILLHKEAIEAVTDPADFKAIQQHPNWHYYERNAKWLAAALLMPAENLIKDARSLYEKIITSLPSEYKYSNPAAIKNKLISLLAKRYKVSPQSMEYRLKNWPVKILEKVDEAMKERLTFLP
ncbi:MAG: ImmA/IrrE family metallo-endopeptidase [Phycisphaerae bacterium]|nr:ImmA/IrrE family metallo-endopeptidase [Phycisphaerae bacterium]